MRGDLGLITTGYDSLCLGYLYILSFSLLSFCLLSFFVPLSRVFTRLSSLSLLSQDYIDEQVWEREGGISFDSSFLTFISFPPSFPLPSSTFPHTHLPPFFLSAFSILPVAPSLLPYLRLIVLRVGRISLAASKGA